MNVMGLDSKNIVELIQTYKNHGQIIVCSYWWSIDQELLQPKQRLLTKYEVKQDNELITDKVIRQVANSTVQFAGCLLFKY